MTDPIPYLEWPDPDGMERQPCDPVLCAKALARARGETYDLERHGPFEPKPKPRPDAPPPVEQSNGNLQELISRFMEKVPPRRPRNLQLVPNDEAEEWWNR